MLLAHNCFTFMHRELGNGTFASRVRNALAYYRGGYLNDGGEPVCGAFELCLQHSRRRCPDPKCADQQEWRLLHLATAARAPEYRVYDRSSGQMWRGLQNRAV